MTRYAANTSVSVEKSRAEIEQLLMRYGATSFMYGLMPGMAGIQFEMNSRRLKFILPLPSRDEKRFHQTPAKKLMRSPEEAYREWEQACRQRWRALALAIKAKLETVECGISTFEDEFMAHIVLPNGSTVSDFMRPQIAQSYETGSMPRMLPMLECAQ
jgi:hypothetical protein